MRRSINIFVTEDQIKMNPEIAQRNPLDNIITLPIVDLLEFLAPINLALVPREQGGFELVDMLHTRGSDMVVDLSDNSNNRESLHYLLSKTDGQMFATPYCLYLRIPNPPLTYLRK